MMNKAKMPWEPGAMQAITITTEEYKMFAELLYRHSGITLPADKRGLLESRLNRVLHREGLDNYGEYYHEVIADHSHRLLTELIDLMSTNHTYFYREKGHFDIFTNEALPSIFRQEKEKINNDVRIWCAGCSSGEEAYMLIILLMEHLQQDYHLWQTGLLATDISGEILEDAQRGVYSSDRMGNLPDYYKTKYFQRLDSNHWQIIPKIKQEVTFRRFNLMNPFPFKNKFHIIFCRNVMIYFDEESRYRLVNNFADFLLPGGYLFIGHSETIKRTPSLRFYKPAVYIKEG